MLIVIVMFALLPAWRINFFILQDTFQYQTRESIFRDVPSSLSATARGDPVHGD